MYLCKQCSDRRTCKQLTLFQPSDQNAMEIWLMPYAHQSKTIYSRDYAQVLRSGTRNSCAIIDSWVPHPRLALSLAKCERSTYHLSEPAEPGQHSPYNNTNLIVTLSNWHVRCKTHPTQSLSHPRQINILRYIRDRREFRVNMFQYGC